MKILKPGVIPEPAQYIGRCRICECVFECTQDDFVYPEVGVWHRGPSLPPHVACPTCGKKIQTKGMLPYNQA